MFCSRTWILPTFHLFYVILLLQQFISYTSAQSYTFSAHAVDTNRFWRSLASSTDGKKMVGASQGTSTATYGGYLYTSSTSGSSWTQRASAGRRNWTAVAASSDGVYYAATDIGQLGSAPGYIYTSADSGSTWTPRKTSGAYYWTSIASSSDGSKLVATAGGYLTGVSGKPFNGTGYIYCSADYGATWTARATDTTRLWTAVASSADGTKLVATARASAASTASGYVWTSANAGSTWSQRTAASKKAWTSVACSADGSKIAASEANNLWVSSNGGSSWSIAFVGDSPSSALVVTSSADGTKLAVASSSTIYSASDGGSTWVQQNALPLLVGQYLSALLLSPDGTRLSVGIYAGYIYTALAQVSTPTGAPSSKPSGKPSSRPSGHPTGHPSGKPTGHPTKSPHADSAKQGLSDSFSDSYKRGSITPGAIAGIAIALVTLGSVAICYIRSKMDPENDILLQDEGGDVSNPLRQQYHDQDDTEI